MKDEAGRMKDEIGKLKNEANELDCHSCNMRQKC